MQKRSIDKEGTSIVIASHNQGKIREIKELLHSFNVSLESAGSLGIGEIEETGNTFHENAFIKAANVAKISGMIAMSDDSGLCIEAIENAPGIYSARWAGEEKDFKKAMGKIEDEVKQSACPPPWKASFNCVLCLAWPDQYAEYFEGVIEGQVIFPPRGNNGFGYDPIFKPYFSDMTFGEMNPEQKNSMNHRKLAFDRLSKRFLSSEKALKV